jgi:adenylate cyclase
MNDAFAMEIGAWVTTAGSRGRPSWTCCTASASERPPPGCRSRALVLIDTLHPIHEGRVFRWSRAPAPDERTVIEVRADDRGWRGCGEVA